MIYTAIDTFYLTEEQLDNSPSRKDGIDKDTENTLRIYGCELIQESGILLRLPQAAMATGQVLLHRFYCKKSLARFNVKRVAASCVWLASKLEETPRKARQVLIVFHRMERRRENLPIEHLNTADKKYIELKADLIRTERHLLKEMGFICHVEHPHKFISNYLATLEAPVKLRQEAWNLANDSLRTTLCVRFKSEVVACGVVYAAARRFHVPLPENPPWWEVFDADWSGIEEVCKTLAHLYSLPKAQYVPVCKDGGSFTTSNRTFDSPSQGAPKEDPLSGGTDGTSIPKGASTMLNENSAKDVHEEVPFDKPRESKKSGGESKNNPAGEEPREENAPRAMSDHREAGAERKEDKDRDKNNHRDRGRERHKSRDRDRGKPDRERERDDVDRDRDKIKDRGRSRDKGKDSGYIDKAKHHSSRDRDYYSSYSSREDRRRRH
ncbi:hypothetical protein Leryth_011436 [Lithospermum erythrorhizon]|uniref:Cyclin-L1-1 n=1 Tax=Lithospermum erythrorhizon TaxID=34254 RepID=A0AAV3PAK3_LITER|nr:hypothetical protein Leryth_011436 [Lithospermum erythrorhizon]